jgi:Tfp pilus assembly protein PilF
VGQIDDAEANFKSAITADPVPSEPYFNLALIYANGKRLEDGREFYQKALERGALPDQSLEKKLGDKR